ncbi:MAG: hypothetical protein HQK63_09865 [Desulfamplus sp.]|nr:hypothetical protein [Desulfamplus sp.]
MITAEEIKHAIESLPEKEYVKLRKWFSKKDWDKWDEAIELDSQAGKLDFLIEEALAQKNKNKLLIG